MKHSIWWVKKIKVLKLWYYKEFRPIFAILIFFRKNQRKIAVTGLNAVKYVMIFRSSESFCPRNFLPLKYKKLWHNFDSVGLSKRQHQKCRAEYFWCKKMKVTIKYKKEIPSLGPYQIFCSVIFNLQKWNNERWMMSEWVTKLTSVFTDIWNSLTRVNSFQ